MRPIQYLRILKKIVELIDDEKTNKRDFPKLKFDPRAAMEVEPGYLSIPYTFRADIFLEIFIKELNLEECKEAFNRLQAQRSLPGGETTPSDRQGPPPPDGP